MEIFLNIFGGWRKDTQKQRLAYFHVEKYFAAATLQAGVPTPYTAWGFALTMITRIKKVAEATFLRTGGSAYAALPWRRII